MWKENGSVIRSTSGKATPSRCPSRRTGTSRGTLAVLLVAVLAVALMASGLRNPAQANPRYAGLVIDAATGEVFYQENARRPLYPASLTKIMTLYMVFEALRDGRLTLDQPLPVSATANAQPPSRIDLPTGGSITVEQAIYALVTKSANNVAVVVAEALGGSEAGFAEMMTQRARQLGMSDTVFRNASGLPNSNQRSTAWDMGILARAMIHDFPREYAYFATQNWRHRGTTYRNHNRLLGQYDGLDGIKTGYIRASGFNLVASARRGELRLIGVVFGGRTGASRNEHMADLLDRAFTSDRGQHLIAHGSVPDFPVPTRHPWRPAFVASADPAPLVPAAERPQTVTLAEAVLLRMAEQQPTPTLAPAAPVVALRPVPAELADTPPPPRPPLAHRPDLVPDTLAAGAAPAAEPGQIAAVLPGGDLPQPNDDAAAAGTWGIQVGAFRTPQESGRALDLAQAHAARLLVAAQPQVVAVDIDGRGQLHRARLFGLSAEGAGAACGLLLQQGMACVTLAPGGQFAN